MDSRMTGKSPEDRECHIVGSTGAILTKFRYGIYRPSYVPLTTYVVAAKAPNGVVLVRPQGCHFWSLPGGPLNEAKGAAEVCAEGFQRETGLPAENIEALGFYRVIVSSKVEHGALAVCRCGPVSSKKAKELGVELRAWRFEGPIAALDPISEALAALAVESVLWRGMG